LYEHLTCLILHSPSPLLARPPGVTDASWDDLGGEALLAKTEPVQHPWLNEGTEINTKEKRDESTGQARFALANKNVNVDANADGANLTYVVMECGTRKHGRFGPPSPLLFLLLLLLLLLLVLLCP